MLVWGYFISTTILYHGTFIVNSLAHVIGRQRFATKDDSRNSLLIALVTLGEGWHNNHHFVPSSERQGFYWWEVDVSHYILTMLSWFGIVWDVKKPPKHVYAIAAEKSVERGGGAGSGNAQNAPSEKPSGWIWNTRLKRARWFSQAMAVVSSTI
jgi:stearoyl-CoA desaturase (delta-9 desaturase)